MKRKLMCLLLFVTMISSMFVGCTGNNVETSGETPGEDSGGLDNPVELTISLTAVSTDTHAKAMAEFKKYVEEKSNGNITVDLYTDATLFTQEEELVGVVAGDIDMTLTSASWLTTNSPWISMFTAGYIFNSYEHMTSVLNGEIGQEVFAKVAEEQGLIPLGAWYLGARQISLSQDKAIKTPADLAGINLRMPNSDAWMFLGRALGANPTPISFSELYLSLQTGVVDGQDNPLPTVESAKFYEVQNSITLTDHLIDSVWPAINPNTWNSLSDEQKQIVLEGIEVGREYCDTTNLQREAELVALFKEQGVVIYEADKTAFANHVLDQYLNNPISDTWDMEIYEQIQKLANN
ncbi:sialic acid TRAP transporter substrate-binding protein SiaP [Natronincola ferrireducens]|uniref:Tripartite ATP-independent transporter solute receptor, DctP family n=1 Tax=Natronincola ferrireducens TaxID=393762 RepID=A0A1G9GIG1_9FIRM|nr:sialic acid TRAP transporter substrate-binding protein SiaP [Natronincola ferrireducens]SDL00468.1 tripartite ATP-independent transporter solute receptor, DctP family [Natronincola ferrireducens]